MWNHLDKEDREYLVNAFKTDGFKVHEQPQEMVAEKNGQKIILRKQESFEIIWDMKKIFEEKNVLLTRVGNIPAGSVLDFLKKERKEKETSFDTLFRIHEKFNWAKGMFGEKRLDAEWKSLGEKVTYSIFYTDNDKEFMAVSFSTETKERLYFINMPFFSFVNFLEAYSPLQAFNDLAPSAFIKLRAYITE